MLMWQSPPVGVVQIPTPAETLSPPPMNRRAPNGVESKSLSPVSDRAQKRKAEEMDPDGSVKQADHSYSTRRRNGNGKSEETPPTEESMTKVEESMSNSATVESTVKDLETTEANPQKRTLRSRK